MQWMTEQIHGCINSFNIMFSLAAVISPPLYQTFHYLNCICAVNLSTHFFQMISINTKWCIWQEIDAMHRSVTYAWTSANLLIPEPHGIYSYSHPATSERSRLPFTKKEKKKKLDSMQTCVLFLVPVTVPSNGGRPHREEHGTKEQSRVGGEFCTALQCLHLHGRATCYKLFCPSASATEAQTH